MQFTLEGGKARPPVGEVSMLFHMVPSYCAMHDVHTVLDVTVEPLVSNPSSF